MASNPTFTLESTSPADRAAKQQAHRRTCREATARARAAARAAGQKVLTLTIDANHIDALDTLMERAGLRNRSQAFDRLMKVARENPQIAQELGL